jgi:hypothetical protein
MQALSIAILFYLSTALATAQSINLTVNTGTVLHSVDPRIYGQSLEPGGIWGEVVRNRSFEETLTQGVWKANGGVLEAAAGNMEARFRFGAEGWRDYDLTIDALRSAGNGVLVIAVRSDPSAHYALSLGGASGFELTRTADDSAATVLQTAPGSSKTAGGTGTCEDRCDAPQAWIDGRMLFDVSYPEARRTDRHSSACAAAPPVSPISV